MKNPRRRKLPVPTAGALVTALVLCPSALAQTFLPPLDQLASTTQAANPSDPGADDARFRSQVARSHALFEGQRDETLREAFEAQWGEAPAAALESLLLRAGSEPAPALTAALSVRREQSRQDALALIRTDLAAGGERALRWLARIELSLSAASARERAVGSAAQDRWCAAARLVAELELRQLAPRVAAGLAQGASDRVREGARSALFRSFRRWFDDERTFGAFWERARDLGPDQLFLEDLRAEQELAQLRLERLVELDPNEAVHGLEDPDPALRAYAAMALAAGVAEDRVRPQEAVDQLLRSLEQEVDPGAFHASFEALLLLLGGAPADSAGVRALRETLDQSAARHPHLTWTLVSAYARLPWDDSGGDGSSSAAPDSLAAGIARIAGLFGERVSSERLLDSDLLASSIESLRSLCARAPADVDHSRSLAPARDALRYLLEGHQGSREVRLAAASAASFVLSPADAGMLVDVLQSEGSPPALRHELLGSLGRLALRVEADSEVAARVFSALVSHVGGPDADLRRRALDVLAGESLELLVQARGAELLLAPLVHSLVREDQAELQARMLALLGRFEAPEYVDTILDAPNFSALAAGDSRRLFELAATLRRLAGADAGRVLRAAESLLGDSNPAPKGDESPRLARLESALSLACLLPQEGLPSITPRQHLEVVGWASELRRSLAGSAGASEAMQPFLERLVSVHLPGVSQADDQGSEVFAHIRALLMGDLFLLRDPQGDPRAILSQYQKALALAQGEESLQAPPGWSLPGVDEVRRDRARFLVASGRGREALADYRALITRGGAHALPVASMALELSDLRRAAALIGEPAPGAERDRRGASGEAFQVSLALVRRPNWHDEPPTVRLQDLRDLATRAMRSHDAAAVESVRSALADVPTQPGVPTPDVQPSAEVRLWSGLDAEPDWHATLLTIKASLPTGTDPEAAGGASVEGSGEAGDQGPTQSLDAPTSSDRR